MQFKTKTNNLHLLTDTRLWILVLFLIRLENIDIPPLDEHSWRQTLTLGVARNYLEIDGNFFHPTTLLRDSRQGVMAQEFPLFNYSIAALWQLFGEHNWIFRLFNLLIATLGLFAFSRIVRRLADESTALYSTVLFGVSVAFVYARKAMPDVFAVSLVLAGVDYGWRYLESKKWAHLAAFGSIAALGMLCKMPAVCTLAFIVAPILHYKESWKERITLSGISLIALAAMACWYFIWVPWAEKTYGFGLFFPTTLAEGWKQINIMADGTISRFYPIALTSRLAFGFFVAGIAMMIWKRQTNILLTFGASTVLIFGLMLKAGATFSGHAYYIIPFVPAMSLVAGYGLSTLIKPQWLQLILLFLIATEAIYQHKTDFFINNKERKLLKLESIVDQFSKPNERILVNYYDGSPVMLYFAHRTSWNVIDRMKDTEWVKGEAAVGMKLLVIDRSRWQDSLPFPRLYIDEDYAVYENLPAKN